MCRLIIQNEHVVCRVNLALLNEVAKRAAAPCPAAGSVIIVQDMLQIALRALAASMAMWEITITCHDGTRLRLSEWTDAAPHKREVVETVDTGQIIKAMIDVCREEKPGGSRPPFFRVTATEL